MRTGYTQATPTASPLVVVVVNGDTHTSEGGGGNDRLVSVYTDEQAWGGEYRIVLDNADETLNAKTYTGEPLDLTFGVIGETGSKLHNLWVHNQSFVSKEGKLTLELTCVDVFGMLSLCRTNIENAAFNMYWQQAEELVNYTLPSGAAFDPESALFLEIVSHYGMTAWEILEELIGYCVETIPQIPDGESDSIIDTITPPITVTNILSGIRQLLEMTKCFLKPRRDNLVGDEPAYGTLRLIQPTLHDSVFAFSTANTHFINIQDSAFVAPNDIYVWAYNPEGDDWIYGNARDTTPYTQFDVRGDYMLASMTTDARDTEENLDLIAEGILSKVQGSVSTSTVVAPMHCSLELFDKVTVTDPRYTTPKVSTGYVMRMVREYSRGVYRITIQLGGVTRGYIPAGGSEAIGIAKLVVDVPPREDIDIDWASILPKAVQGYWHDLHFEEVDQTHIKWNAGTITFYDAGTLTVSADANSLIPNTGIYYIYFDSRDTAPITLKYTTDFAALLTEANAAYLGMLCMVQRGSAAAIMPTILPSYGKEPLITTDMIQMAGFKSWTDPATGTVYDAILHTDMSSGHILLSSVVQSSSYRTTTDTEKGTWNGKPDDMDEIGEGSTYRRVRATQIDSGYLKLTSDTVKSGVWYNEGGVKIDAAHGITIWGDAAAFRTRATESGADVCYMDSSGNICAASGAVKLGSSGIIIDGQKLFLYNSTTLMATFGYTGGHTYIQAVTDLFVGTASCYIGFTESGTSSVFVGSVLQPSGSADLGSSTNFWDKLFINQIKFSFVGAPTGSVFPDHNLDFGYYYLVTCGWSGSVFYDIVPHYAGGAYNSESIGISTFPYDEGYFYDLYYWNIHDLDTEKDSAIIKSLKSKGDGTLDIDSFPEVLRRSGVKKLEKKQTEAYKLTEKGSIPTEPGKPEKKRDSISEPVHAGALMGLVLGTLKELIDRVESLEKSATKE